MGTLKELDKLILAKWIGGYSGDATISAECGNTKNCFWCALLCRVLDVFWPGHCLHAAQREILTPDTAHTPSSPSSPPQ
jgi:hypothetical protein